MKVTFSRAEGYFFSGRYSEAIVDYTEVIAAEPRHALAFRCRAAAYAALGQEPPALADYARAVELDPRLDDAWLGRGVYLYARGRYAEALEDLDRAGALDPRSAVVERYRALACERVGRLRGSQPTGHTHIHCRVTLLESDLEARPEPREVKALGLGTPPSTAGGS